MHKTGCQYFLLQDVLTASFVNFWLYCFVLFLVCIKGKLVFHMDYPSIWNVFTSTLMCLTGIQFTLLNHSPLQTGAHCLCLFQLFAIPLIFKTTTEQQKHEHTVCGFISVLQFHWFSHWGALMHVCVSTLSQITDCINHQHNCFNENLSTESNLKYKNILKILLYCRQDV